MPRVFIGVGSNLGDRAGYLEFAEKELLSIAGLTDLKCSPVHETEPVDAAGGRFLNAVWGFETILSPRELLERLQKIESKAGRCRSCKGNGPYEARTLDLDILFYGDQVICEEGMVVPHPRLHERPFVLMPFCELAPEFIHPVFRKSVKELYGAVRN